MERDSNTINHCKVAGPTPKDILSPEEVLAHERAVQRAAEAQRYLRRTQRILRLQHLQWLSHREFLASFGKASALRKRREIFPMVIAQKSFNTHSESVTSMPSEPQLPDLQRTLVIETKLPILLNKTTESSKISGTISSIPNSTNLTEDSQEGVLATVHRLAIRSKTILISGGVMRTRLRYLIQLHRSIVGQYKLLVEVRLHPQYPPIYTG